MQPTNEEKSVVINPNYMTSAPSLPYKPTPEQLRERSTLGLGFPYGLNEEEFSFVRSEAARGMSISTLARHFFGSAGPREYMRVRSIVSAKSFRPTGSETRRPFADQRQRPSRSGGSIAFPYGLNEDQFAQVFSNYKAGVTLKRIAKQMFRRDDGRYQARIRRIVEHGIGLGLIEPRPWRANAAETGRLGGLARAKAIRERKAASLNEVRAAAGRAGGIAAAQNRKKLEAKALTVAPAPAPAAGELVSGETKVFAELANVYLQRLRKTLRGDDLSAVGKAFDDLRSALQEMNATLPRKAQGTSEIV